MSLSEENLRAPARSPTVQGDDQLVKAWIKEDIAGMLLQDEWVQSGRLQWM